MRKKFIASSKILMQAAKSDLYKTNAFRISGLPIDATTRDISLQIDRIRMMKKYGGKITKSEGPFPLNPPPDSDNMREALQRLRDPERRLIDEFFWFWPHIIGQGKSDNALQAISSNNINKAKEIWIKHETMSSESNVSMHNLAVLSHLQALDLESEDNSTSINVKDKKMRDYYWLESLKRWKTLLNHEGFWKRLAERVIQLDDPRLTTGTVKRIRETLPVSLLFINANLAVKAAESGNNSEAKRHMKIIKDSGFDNAVIESALAKAITSIRNRIKTICNSADEEGDENPEKCIIIAEKVIIQTKKLLSILNVILPTDSPIRIGAHDEVALSTLGNIITFGNKTEKWKKPYELVKKILEIAISESARSRIQMNHDTIKSNYESDKSYGTCFFCKENTPDETASIDQPMHGEVHNNGYQITWRHLSIEVPRCSSCKKIHITTTTIATISFFIFLVLGIVLFSSILDEDQWFIGLVGCGIISSIAAWIGFALTRSKFPDHIKPKSDESNFPPIQELIKKGWAFGEKPSEANQ